MMIQAETARAKRKRSERRSDGQAQFLTLPTELRQYLLGFVTIQNVCRVRVTCQALRDERAVWSKANLASMKSVIATSKIFVNAYVRETCIRGTSTNVVEMLAHAKKSFLHLRHLEILWSTLVRDAFTYINNFRESLEVLILHGCTVLHLSHVSLGPFDRLHTLNLSGSVWVRDKDLENLPPSLAKLNLTDCVAVSNLGLVHIVTRAPQLKNLKFEGCLLITDDGLIHVANLRCLERLHVTQITDVGLGYFAAMDCLQSLKAPFCRAITDAGLTSFAQRSRASLSTLHLWECDSVTNVGFEAILSSKTIVKLKNLMVSCKRVTDAGFTHLKHLQSIEILAMADGDELTGAGLAHVASLSILQELSLPNLPNVAAGGFGCLSQLVNLVNLHLAHNPQLSDADIVHFASLTSLQKLDLTQCVAVGVDGLACIASLPKLEILLLNECGDGVCTAGLQHFAQSRSLHTLRLRQCRAVTDDGLAHLATVKTLQVLDLSHCASVTDRGVASLAALPDLKVLDLRGCILVGVDTKMERVRIIK